MVDDLTKKLAQGKNIASVTTLHADGTPMTHPMWIDAEDEYLILNTEVDRHKFRNPTRDPPATVAIWEGTGGDPYREVRGALIGDARGVAAALAIAAAIGFAAAGVGVVGHKSWWAGFGGRRWRGCPVLMTVYSVRGYSWASGSAVRSLLRARWRFGARNHDVVPV